MMKVRMIGKLVRDAWLMVGITVVLFCLLEGSLSLAFYIKDRLAVGPQIFPDTYSDPTWVDRYNEEDAKAAEEWRPYVYWRHEPYHGNYINIDTNGIRQTGLTKSIQQESCTPTRIYMFGGSTMWGAGARDAFTIPSIFTKELQDKGLATEVTNFGEVGYVSTQEVITLVLQLQKGQLPDLVIFYDGVNDTYSAYEQHVAGLPYNEFNRLKEFNLTQPDKLEQLLGPVLQDLAARLSTIRLMNGLLRRAGVRSETAVGFNPSFVDSLTPRSEALARDVLATYTGNIEVVKALSKHYHFKYLFYWQPLIFQKVNLTEFERARRTEMQTTEAFFQRTYEVIRQSGLSEGSEYSFHDLSLIFADVREPLYTDFCHLGESGNEIIAKRMASDVLGLIIANK